DVVDEARVAEPAEIRIGEVRAGDSLWIPVLRHARIGEDRLVDRATLVGDALVQPDRVDAQVLRLLDVEDVLPHPPGAGEAGASGRGEEKEQAGTGRVRLRSRPAGGCARGTA